MQNMRDLRIKMKGRKMMNDINRVLLLGRLGADPVLRETQNGTKVASFSLATEYYLKTKNASETSWHRVVVWGKPAEKCNDELKKGMPVFIEGKMKSKKYEDKQGETKYVYEVHADQVRFLHRKLNLRSSFIEQEANAESVQEASTETPLQWVTQ